MIKRDEVYRKELNDNVKQAGDRPNAPASIQIPPTPTAGWPDNVGAITPRANGNAIAKTPSLSIGVASPGPLTHLPGVLEDETADGKRASRSSADKSGDYFSTTAISSEASAKPVVAGDRHDEKAKSPLDTEKESSGKDKDGGNRFGKFRMGMSFGSKKLGRSSSTNTEKPVVTDEKAEDSSEPSENGEKEKEVDDSFHGIVQKIRNEYEKLLQEYPGQQVESGITPSLPNETPVLKPPPLTTVIIQEETSGGSADLYRGTVACVGEDASLIEERAPMWLGDLLLRVSSTRATTCNHLTSEQNKIPIKDPVKVSFVLQPFQDLLPSIAGPDGNSRLNANRMLRVKKILAYVSERIETPPEQADSTALRPEEYLELYCYDMASFPPNAIAPILTVV